MPHRYDPAHWRERAAQMRLLASEMNDPEAGVVMLKLANDYDNLADSAENRVKELPAEKITRSSWLFRLWPRSASEASLSDPLADRRCQAANRAVRPSADIP